MSIATMRGDSGQTGLSDRAAWALMAAGMGRRVILSTTGRRRVVGPGIRFLIWHGELKSSMLAATTGPGIGQANLTRI